MKLQHNKPVWASNEANHIPLMQHWNVLCLECLWVNNIGAITSWRSCEVETSLHCRQDLNHKNKTCSGSDAARMHKVLFKTIWLSSKSSFHNIFLCLCLLRAAQKLWFFCVFMCSEVLKVEFTKANIHLFVFRKVFMVIMVSWSYWPSSLKCYANYVLVHFQKLHSSLANTKSAMEIKNS